MKYTINNKEIKGDSSQRVCGLDLIRVMAIFFVIAGHFLFINTAYQETPIQSVSVFIQRMMMTVFYVSVPLFMMLTGYLNIKKTPTKKYYIGMIRVLVAYLVFSMATILFRTYYLGEERSIVQWVLAILNYSAIPYAWYIEMWIGLALLAPFLNYLWHAVPTIRKKALLIGTLFLLTSLPETINERVELFPDYFEIACYPLMFYFMGTFIREYQPTIKTWLGLAIILLISMVNPIATLVMGGTNCIDWSLGGGPNGVLCT